MKLRCFLIAIFVLASVCAYADEIANPLAIIEAKSVEYAGSKVSASGNVLFIYENKRMSCDEIEYNLFEKTGFVRNLAFTTCIKEKRHYTVRAREVEFLKDNMVRMAGFRLYIGKKCILSVPFKISHNIKKDISDTLSFPLVGYGSDGFTLSKSFKLADSDRVKAAAVAQVGTKTRLRGSLKGEWGLDGTLDERDGRYFIYEDIYEEKLQIPRPFKKRNDTKKPAKWIARATVSNNEEVYDPSDENFSINRQPELAITYTANPINLTKYTPRDPRLEMYPQLRSAWGRFKECDNGTDTKSRFNLGATFPVNIANFGDNAALTAVFGYDYYSYSSHRSYHKYMYALDYKRYFDDGSELLLRYIDQTDSGKTPFNFDNVDLRECIQLSYIRQLGKHVYGVGLNYNLDKNEFYDWQLMYGRKTDCLAWAVIYENKDSKIRADFALLSF